MSPRLTLIRCTWPGAILCLSVLCGCQSQMLGAKNTVSESHYVALQYLAKAQGQDPTDRDIDAMADSIIRSSVYNFRNTPRYEAPAEALTEYDRCMAIKDHVEKYLGKNYPPLDVNLDRLVEAAAEEYYVKGKQAYQEALELGSHEKCREAVVYFDRCRGCHPSYRDVAHLRAQALQCARSKLTMVPLGDGPLARAYADKVKSRVERWRPRFLKWVDDPAVADGRCILEVDDRFYDTHWQSRTDTNMVKEKKKRDDGTRYTKTYRARWTIRQRTQRLHLIVRYEVQTNRSDLPSPSGVAEHSAEYTKSYVAGWSGDKEALPALTRVLPKRQPEMPGRLGLLDKHEDLAKQLAAKIFRDYEY